MTKWNFIAFLPKSACKQCIKFFLRNLWVKGRGKKGVGGREDEEYGRLCLLTSPLASRVFIRSRKLLSSTLDSSMMKISFSSLQPARRSTALRSSSKSAAVYLRWTCRQGGREEREEGGGREENKK